MNLDHPETVVTFGHDDGLQLGGPIGAVLYSLALGHAWLRDGKSWSLFGAASRRAARADQIDKAVAAGLLTIAPGMGAGVRNNAEQLQLTPEGRAEARRWAAGRAIQLLSKPPVRARHLDWSRDDVMDNHQEAFIALRWAVTGRDDDILADAEDLPGEADDAIAALTRFLTGVSPDAATLPKQTLTEEARVERFTAVASALADTIFLGVNIFEAQRLAGLFAAIFSAALWNFASNGDAFFGGDHAEDAGAA